MLNLTSLVLLAATALDPVEQKIVEHVDANEPKALALLERAVNQNSGSQNHEGVRAVGAIFRQELDALGLATEWVDGAPFQRAGHLVARKEGSGPRILLVGHLDTVFEADDPFQKFERIDAHTARGPGVIDMKGGDVIIVQALAALRATDAWPAVNVTVVMTGDEEDTGEPLALARKALLDAAQGADYAIGFENGSGDPTKAITARRGISTWQLRVEGKGGHSSQVFNEDPGNGAIFEAARFLETARTTLSKERYLSFNPGVIVGGSQVTFDAAAARGTAFGKSNVVASSASASGDLRTITKEQLDAAMATMHDIASRSRPGTTSTLTFDGGYPSLAPKPGNDALLVQYDAISRELGLGAVTATDPNRAGAADVAFIGELVPAVIDGIGLMGHSDHSAGETADLRTLPTQTKRAALLVKRLATRK